MKRPVSVIVASAATPLMALLLSGCGPVTPTSRVLDAAKEIVTQLPNSSPPESPSKWIRDFNEKGQTGGGGGNVLSPAWHDGPWADWGIGGSSAYSVTIVNSKVVLKIAILRIGPGEQGLTTRPDSSYICVQTRLTPGRNADMTNLPCPQDVRDRASATAPGSLMVSLPSDLHADAKR